MSTGPRYQTLGNIDLEHTLPPGAITGYLRTLDIGDAISTADFVVSGVAFHRESFASAPDHAIISRCSTSGKGRLSFVVRLSRIASAHTTAEGNNTLIMRGDTTLPLRPAGQPAPATCTTRRSCVSLPRAAAAKPKEITLR